jgi:myosin heavy subunit
LQQFLLLLLLLFFFFFFFIYFPLFFLFIKRRKMSAFSSCATTTNNARATSDIFFSSFNNNSTIKRSSRRTKVVVAASSSTTKGVSKNSSSFFDDNNGQQQGVQRLQQKPSSSSSSHQASKTQTRRRSCIVANASSSSFSNNNNNNKEKFERLKDMLDAVSEALDVSSKVQLSLDEANGKVARLESKVKERDRLLSIVRGLEIELADSYTPKEVDELVKNLKREREKELDQLKKELEETKSLREKVQEMMSLEKEKETAKKEALENGEKLIKAEIHLENLKRESSMQSMELQGKMESAEREAKQLKAEIRRLETRMADMVDVEETDEEMDRLKGELEDAKVKSDTVPILQQALKEMTTERDDLRKLLREVEAAMAEMTENKEFVELIKEKNNLSVKSQVADFQLKTKKNEPATQDVSKQPSMTKAETDKLWVENCIEQEYCEVEEGGEKEQQGKTLSKAETDKLWVENCVEQEYCEVEEDKQEQGKKKSFQRAPAGDFTMNRKIVSAENVSSTEDFTARKGAFERTPGQFTLRKFAFDSPSKRRVSVPATAFKRTGEFELRRFIFTSDEVDVDATETVAGGFKRTPGSFTLRRFNFRDSNDSEEEKSSPSSTLFRF